MRKICLPPEGSVKHAILSAFPEDMYVSKYDVFIHLRHTQDPSQTASFSKNVKDLSRTSLLERMPNENKGAEPLFRRTVSFKKISDHPEYQPHTGLEVKSTGDHTKVVTGYLLYGHKQLELTLLEYALVTSLFHRKGLKQADVISLYSRLKGAVDTAALETEVTIAMERKSLNELAMKITTFFANNLCFYVLKDANQELLIEGTRLLTQNEYRLMNGLAPAHTDYMQPLPLMMIKNNQHPHFVLDGQTITFKGLLAKLQVEILEHASSAQGFLETELTIDIPYHQLTLAMTKLKQTLVRVGYTLTNPCHTEHEPKAPIRLVKISPSTTKTPDP